MSNNNFDAVTKISDSRLTQRQMFQVKVQQSDKRKCVGNTLHHALAPFLVISRFFGILPVLGVWPGVDVKQLQFRWISLPVMVTITMIGFAFLDFCLTLKVLTEQGLKLTTTVFLFLSRKWPHLIKSTHRLEVTFSQSLYTCNDSQNFSQRIRFIGWLFLIGSVIEHLFYVASGLYSNHLQIKQCNLTVDFLNNYYVRERLQIFSIMDYTVWLIPLLQWLTISMTFAWNFIDIFIILICHGLTRRFRQFHWCIKVHIKENMTNEFWLQRREDFLALTDLLWQYDDKLSIPVLLSSAQNLYFLAVQIFHIFHPRDNFMKDLYFWFSLSFVTFRTFYMMLSASNIHDTANAIMTSIYEIPTAHWCLELKRLNEVIVSDLYALSGKGFFYLTRRLMFAMAGTLVVYELVLLDQVDGSDVMTPLCNERKS
ncbi:gustatory receptor 64c isoform 2-T2 [Cochliomyia hominivorax]